MRKQDSVSLFFNTEDKEFVDKVYRAFRSLYGETSARMSRGRFIRQFIEHYLYNDTPLDGMDTLRQILGVGAGEEDASDEV